MFKNIYLLLIFGYGVVSLQNKEDELLEKTIQALNKSFDFILGEIEHMNVDGILGVTEAEAHLRKAMEYVKDPDVKQKVSVLIAKARKIYELQLPNLRSTPYKYYVFNNYVLPPEIWMRDLEFSYGKLDPNPTVYTGPYDVDDVLGFVDYIFTNTFSEAQSDSCLVEVAAATNNTELHDCPVSDTCVDYMLTMPTTYLDRFSAYGITHMLLFLQIARARNCTMDKVETDKLINQECSYILWELRKNVQHGIIPNIADLMLEQIQMCGAEGFGEFLEQELLEHILDIQESHGGFGGKRLSRKQLKNGIRRKRESNPMKYGTNNHTTGLAVSVLSLFIRLLITKPFSGAAFYYYK